MLVRAPNESVTRPYMGVICEDNPTGCPALATLLHLIDLKRAYGDRYVLWTEQQLIEAYRMRGIELVRWTLSL